MLRAWPSSLPYFIRLLVIVMLARTSCSFIASKSALKRPSRLFSSSADEVKSFALEYTYVPNMAEKRVPHRPAHLDYTKSYIQNKTLIAGGAFVPELEAGLLIFKAKRSVVEEYAKGDPYVTKGLVTEYKIREWNIAVGAI